MSNSRMPGTVVVGLGKFGLAIGRRIAAVKKEEAVGIETDPRRRSVWETLTGRPAYGRLDEVDVGQVRRVMLVVKSEDQVETLFDQILARVAADRTTPLHLYIVSTLSKAFAQGLGRRAPQALKLVEFPLTGGEVAALNGTLVAMAAGLHDDGERAFMASTIAARIIDFENYGDPAFAKLLNNAVIAYQAAALSEVLRLGADQGLTPSVLLEVISNGAATSYISKAIRHYNDALLSKDMALLRTSLKALPEINIDRVEDHFAAVRKLLS